RDLDARADQPAVDVVAAAAGVTHIFLEVGIGAEGVQRHAPGQRVAGAEQVLLQLLVRPGVPSGPVLVVHVLAVHVGEREAPGAGLVSDAGIPDAAVRPATVVLLAIGAAEGEPGIAEVEAGGPDFRRRVQRGPARAGAVEVGAAGAARHGDGGTSGRGRVGRARRE